MSQYLVYGIAAAMLVLSGLGEYLRLLPGGTFSAVFAAVLGGVAGFHIPDTTKQTKSTTPETPTQPVTLGPLGPAEGSKPVPDKLGRQDNT